MLKYTVSQFQWGESYYFGLFVYNNIAMSKKQLLSIYIKLQGNLQKKSSNFFLGFQPKHWKIFQQGNKIAYKNINQQQFIQSKTFQITEVQTEETQDPNVFLLHTPNRIYELRAETEESRRQWMRAITLLKKQIRKKNKLSKTMKKIVLVKNPNDSTLPSIDPFNQLNITNSALNQTLPPRFTHATNSKLSSEFYSSKEGVDDQLKEKFKEHLKRLGPLYAHYHVYICKLTTKNKELFLTNNLSHYYILFSSKSLNPEEFISEQNLTSSQLPHWADPDAFYRLSQDKSNCKLVLQLGKIQQVIEAQATSSLKIVTPHETFQFYCDSLLAVNKFKEVLEIARVNAIETSKTNGKKNYDNLILLHSSNLEEFNQKVHQLITPLLPINHAFEPEVVRKLIQKLSPFIVEVLGILENKVNTPTNTMVGFLQIIHEQVRTHLKLVWDSSYSLAKGGDILNILKSVSRYENLVNKYVKDNELEDALKELSKFYTRNCYKNFQSVILGIVIQQRKDNYFLEEEEGEEPYYQTHGVTDLFKFIYDVFQLAIPCWNNRLHLYNINRLIKRALALFISQLKATVDEQDISNNELIAISNNYVKFNQQVQELYESKLSQLKQQTRQSYDTLRNDYREISMIVIDKLVLPLKLQLKIFFEKQGFYTANMEDVYKKIVQSGVKNHTKYVHFIFKKRYFQRIFSTVKEEICKMLQKQAKKIGKKKPEMSKVIEKIQVYKKDCCDMAQHITPSKLKVLKQFDQLKALLTSSKREQIKMILSESSQFYKRVYKNILLFRQDYSQGNHLYTYINSIENQNVFKELAVLDDKDRRRSSTSKYYIQQLDRHSITSSLEKDKFDQIENGQQKIKMISEGYVKRSKNSIYEQIYLKLKQSVLYIYENDRMERCQNTIQIENMLEISLPNSDKPTFVILFTALNRNKQMRIRCQNMEECSRWVYSLQLEMRRINNDKKMKSKGIKIKEKKSKLVIDYQELMNGPDYFSYSV